jgi:hypothetical protein
LMIASHKFVSFHFIPAVKSDFRGTAKNWEFAL